MNLEQLQQKLLTAARANPPSDRVPYAFEKRIMAHLKAVPVIDLSALWARALWRAAAPCVVLTLALGAWSFFAANPGAGTEDLSQDFEQTMLAVVDQPEEVW